MLNQKLLVAKRYHQPGASSIAFWSWENLALMSSDLCFWNRDEEGDQQSPHWRKKETIKESRFFHLYFVDSKGCLFFNLVPPFTTFLKEERAQYVFILSFLMLLQREKSTKNKLLKKWQICSNNNKKKSGSKKLTSVTGVVKRISQLLLLLLIRCSISIEFFSCLEYAVFELLQWA